MKPIQKNTIKEFDNAANSDKHVRSIRNATFRNNLIEVAMDWDLLVLIYFEFTLVENIP